MSDKPVVVRVAPPAVHVPDLQKAELFFRSVLGFQVVERTRSVEDDVAVVALAFPGSGAAVKLIGETGQGEPVEEWSSSVTLYVEGLAAYADALRGNGVEFEELPLERGGRLHFARFTGPDECPFELIEGLQPS